MVAKLRCAAIEQGEHLPAAGTLGIEREARGMAPVPINDFVVTLGIGQGADPDRLELALRRDVGLEALAVFKLVQIYMSDR